MTTCTCRVEKDFLWNKCSVSRMLANFFSSVLDPHQGILETPEHWVFKGSSGANCWTAHPYKVPGSDFLCFLSYHSSIAFWFLIKLLISLINGGYSELFLFSICVDYFWNCIPTSAVEFEKGRKNRVVDAIFSTKKSRVDSENDSTLAGGVIKVENSRCYPIWRMCYY